MDGLPYRHRARHSRERCERCGCPPRDCVCGEFAPLELATRVVVLMHRREVFKTTNTARLATVALANAELRIVGRPEDRVQFDDLAAPASRCVLLYPTANAQPLTPELAHAGPLTLVVPDGNWRQAKKMACNEEQLAELPRVALPPGPPTRYALRTHPDPRFLATFEAIARALGVLEGDAVQRQLEQLFELKIERALQRNPSRKPAPTADGAALSHGSADAE